MVASISYPKPTTNLHHSSIDHSLSIILFYTYFILISITNLIKNFLITMITLHAMEIITHCLLYLKIIHFDYVNNMAVIPLLTHTIMHLNNKNLSHNYALFYNLFKTKITSITSMVPYIMHYHKMNMFYFIWCLTLFYLIHSQLI
jgi:hypothetical protein